MRFFAVAALGIGFVACSGHPFEAFFANGERHLSAKRYSEAAIEFQNAARINPESALLQAHLGEVYAALHQIGPAAAAYRRACTLNPRDPKPCVEAAANLLAMGDYDEAIAYARTALAADQYSLDAQLILGSALAGVRRFAEAEERLQAALAQAPQDPRPYRSLGNLQRQRGNAAAAEAWLRKAIDRAPASADARVDLARVYMESGRVADGEHELRSAVAADPNDADANEALARHLVDAGRCDDAEAYWNRLAAQTTDGTGVIALADFYVSQQRYDDAIRVLQNAKDSRHRSAVDVRIASIRYDRGDRGEAGELLDRVLNRDPSSVEALLLKTRIALDRNDVSAARDYAHRAAAIAPDEPSVRNMLASATAAGGSDRR